MSEGKALHLSQKTTDRLAEDAANYIKRMIPKHGIKAYGIPRGGVPASYLVASYFDDMLIVSDPADAEIFIDDIIDSGATRNRYATKYPDIPFVALIDKTSEASIYRNSWIVFRWEITEEGSAEDIPVRLLQFIGEDATRGGLLETPKRFLKAWKHYTSGYGRNPKDIMKSFEDGADKCDEMVLVRDIPIFSHCEHHCAPFYGVAHIAYIPDGRIVGLSKLVRLADIFMRRLQVQERLTVQIAEALNEELKPKGVGVVIVCAHTCMIGRGVSVQGSTTITSSMLGAFKENPETRAEFLALARK